MEILLKSSVVLKNECLKELNNLAEIHGIKLIIDNTNSKTFELLKVEFINSIFEKTTYEKVIAFYNDLSNYNLVLIGEEYQFEFQELEYETAPFLQIVGVGNSGGGYLTGSEKSFYKEVACESCKRIKLTQIAPLLVDTSRLKKRYILFVNDHLVISEKFAKLLEEWGMKGYELKAVTHKGNPIKQQPAYQLIPTHYMPKCSSDWKQVYFHTEDYRCFDCRLTGFINTPYAYETQYLEGLENDFYCAFEPQASHPFYYYHDVLISQRLRRKLLEHGITKNGKGRFNNENYKSKDWAFQPIVVKGGN